MATSKDLGRVRLVWQGEYDEETQYTYLDAVSYEGSSYMCFTETPPPVGALPTDEDYFLVLAEKGSPSDATENSYLWLKESGSVVQCSPVPESELDLKVYFAPVETPPEEGEKGPENPSTISGWGEIEVTRCGKNLFDALPNDGDWYTTETGFFNNTHYFTEANTFLHAGTYTLSFVYYRTAGQNLIALGFEDGSYKTFAIANTLETETYTSVTFTLDEPKRLRLFSIASSGSANYIRFKQIQIETGSEATTYEPYIGDTYTITLPDTFYGGYVDFERGVLVQTHQKIAFDGTENWSHPSGSGLFQAFSPLRLGDYYPINNLFTQGVHPADTTEVCVIANGGNTSAGWAHIAVYHVGEQLGYTTVDAWKTYLAQLATAGSPLEVVYELFTPIEHQLEDLVPIKALTQTDRYTPQINTIFSNTNGNVEVGYAKSPIKEHLDLINAITATGGANV